MAKNKRPQKSVHASGVPTAQIQTGVSPVDTFVDPGFVGAPQQKEGTVAPNQPDMQAAKDKHAMGAAFKDLSVTAGQYQMSFLNLKLAWEERGREQGALNEAMRTTNQSFSEGMEKGDVPPTDHPSYAVGVAKGEASLHVEGIHRAIMADLESYRASNPDLGTIEGSMRWYDGMQANATWPKLSRPDIFESEIIKKQSHHRNAFEMSQRKYLSTKGLNTATEAVGTNTRAIIASGYADDIEPTVQWSEGTLFPAVVKVVAKTKEEQREERVKKTAADITREIDESLGGMLLPEIIHEQVGRALIDIAVKSADSQEALFALDVLRSTKTGQKGGRGTLLGINSVETYYAKMEKSAMANIYSGSKTTIKSAHANQIVTLESGLVEGVAQIVHDEYGTFNQEMMLHNIRSGFKDGYNPNTGYTEVLRGDSVEYYADVDGNGELEKVGTINIKNAVAQSVDQAITEKYNRSKSDHIEKSHGDYMSGLISEQKLETELEHADVAALITTSIETNQTLPALNEVFTTSYRRVGNDVVLGGEVSQATKDAIEKGMYAYNYAISIGNDSSLKEMIPDGDTRRFFNALSIIQKNEMVATRITGGTTIENIFTSLPKIKSASAEIHAQMDSEWTTAGGEAVVRAHFKDNKYYNKHELIKDVKEVARILYTLGGQDIATAITDAAESRKERLVSHGGFMIDKGEVHPAFLRRGIPLGPNGEIISELWIKADTFGLPADVPLGVVIDAGENIPKILDAYLSIENANYVTFEQYQESVSVMQETLGDMAEGMSRYYKPAINRTIDINEAVDAAIDTLKTNPPREWISQFPAAMGEIVGLRMIEGTRGFAYTVAIQPPDGGALIFEDMPRPDGTSSPLTLVDIIKMGAWKDRPTKGSDAGAVFKGRHPSNILGGLTGQGIGGYDKDGNWEWDIDAVNRRLMEVPHIMERGVNASDILTTTGVIKQ